MQTTNSTAIGAKSASFFGGAVSAASSGRPNGSEASSSAAAPTPPGACAPMPRNSGVRATAESPATGAEVAA